MSPLQTHTKVSIVYLYESDHDLFIAVEFNCLSSALSKIQYLYPSMVESLDGDRRSACLSFNLKMLFLLLTIEFEITWNLDDVEMFHFFHWAYLTSHPPPSTIKPRPDQTSPAHCWKIVRPSPSDFVGTKMR